MSRNFLRQPDHRHIRVFEEPDRFTDPGDLVERIVEKVDDIAFVVPVDQLRAVKRIAVVQNHGGRVHLGGLQIVLEPKFPGDEEQELVVIVNMTERQTVGGRSHMKHGRAVVCENIGKRHRKVPPGQSWSFDYCIISDLFQHGFHERPKDGCADFSVFTATLKNQLTKRRVS
ncbi:MAG: hypothetical protein IKQ92_00145 [Clostridia bacterium]|nr:hypothetical protein [Clostridia bacterium]